MIFELVLISIFFFIIVPVVYRAGQIHSRIQILKHQHIWNPWEDTKMNMIDTLTGRIKYTVNGQKRYCLDCNEKETKLNESY
jgi:hypothetical protein